MIGHSRAGNSAINEISDCFGSAVLLSAGLRAAMALRRPVYGSVHGFWYPRRSPTKPHLYSHTRSPKKIEKARKRPYEKEMSAYVHENGKDRGDKKTEKGMPVHGRAIYITDNI